MEMARCESRPITEKFKIKNMPSAKGSFGEML